MVAATKHLHRPSTLIEFPRDWGWERLDEICETVDCPHSTPILTSEGPLIVRSQDVRSGIFRTEEAGHVSENTYLDRAVRAEPRHGDLVYSREGTYFGIAAEVPLDTRVCLGQRMVLLRPDQTKVHFRFLRYWLNSPLMAGHIHGLRDGTVAERLNLPTIRGLPIVVPPLSEQRAIAHVLGALDDKIELNRRMNETLQAIAQALFKAMFIDATANGLPNGWQEGKFYRLATLSRETINPGEFPEETFDHYSIPAFDEGRLPKTEAGVQIKSNKFVVPTNAVMISKLNPRIPRVWLPKVNAARRSVSSTEFLIAIPKPGISREYIYGLCSSPSFLDVFATLVTGTSGSHQRVKAEYLLAMDVEIGPTERIGEFSAHTKPLLDRIAHNLQESRSLAALRDALLPRLLSGELRVRLNN